jgi:hypothetical protein
MGWNPLKDSWGAGTKSGEGWLADPIKDPKDAWQNVVSSDWGWAVPFAWPEKVGSMAGMWGPGGVTDPLQAPMAPMMGAGAGLGTMNIFTGGGQPQRFQDVTMQPLQGQATRGAGNIAQTFNQQPQMMGQQQRQPYFLGSGGLGRLT